MRLAMAEHDVIYVNGVKQEHKAKKIKLPPDIDWEKEVRRKLREQDAEMELHLTEAQREKLKPKDRRGL
jgi:hypothetical protein